MKTLSPIYICIILFISINGYSQTKEIYTNPQFSAIAKDHRTLAILPFEVTMQLRPKQMEKMTPEQHSNLEKNEGLAVQSALESYFLSKKVKKGYSVNFQSIGKTNAILAKNEITQENIATYTPEELSELLEVDGIIHGTLFTEKPLSDGAAIALETFVRFYGPTNSGKITINTHDASSGALLWKYEKTLSRGLGSDMNTIINNLMRKASRKFPYKKI